MDPTSLDEKHESLAEEHGKLKGEADKQKSRLQWLEYRLHESQNYHDDYEARGTRIDAERSERLVWRILSISISISISISTSHRDRPDYGTGAPYHPQQHALLART